MMGPDEIAALGAEMAQFGIVQLRLTGPEFSLTLTRGGAAAADEDAPAPEADIVPIIATGLGSFRRNHPLHETPLAAEGETVAAGQAIALLQVGPLLLPVTAPAEGIIAAALPDEGALVGYGDRLFDFLPAD